LTDVGFRFFFAFFVFNLCAVVCYIFFYPETKGRTLEQMGELFGDQIVPTALHDLHKDEKKGSVSIEPVIGGGPDSATH
jgi:hypothetical protein